MGLWLRDGLVFSTPISCCRIELGAKIRSVKPKTGSDGTAELCPSVADLPVAVPGVNRRGQSDQQPHTLSSQQQKQHLKVNNTSALLKSHSAMQDIVSVC